MSRAVLAARLVTPRWTSGPSGSQEWFRESVGATTIVVHIHSDHAASQAAARHLGLRPTAQSVGGEQRWQS
ncbi:hypothetical protein [Subtercola boreus]|uniref:hypothetical protein n=1 Tax=Subtercola boreus TaxID=120213 RepID=UPI001558CAD6|nr:hypothetical protein [Subtercola boreus]